MYEFECLTKGEKMGAIYNNECSPFLGGCYPEAEDCCGPDCSPSDGCEPDYSPNDGCEPDCSPND